ncbi:conjugal transfer protein TraF [[Haemophilus] felis]|uniref:Conjugal transfer protein TraF n=1 Tax=[Haemophilus] felis TaxID=123822 RepID=A0A1T0AXV1_9PAST|nr:conjugal transfer protein TraF [[Haemophilus] felis]OOS02489.1 conjugal transfer protein TraF [[Haemophilus] felis]
MSNQDNKGHIPSVDEASEITTNRNNIETGIKRKGNKAVKVVFAILAALIAFGGIALTLFNFDKQQQTVEVKQDEALKNQGYDQNSLASQMEAIKKQQAEEERLKREAEERERLRREQEERERLAREQEALKVQQIATGQPMNNGDYQEQQTITPEQRRLEGDTMIAIESSRNERGGSEERGSNDAEINEMLSGGVYPKGSTKIVKNRNLLLTHGTQIPCALQTRLITDQPSILICQVTKDIFSADGSTLLVERGSKVFGEQKKAIITGQNQAFVSWSEIDTPHGIRVRIDSLGTDSLGASGLNVWVDEKWGKRFGGAMLLSFIQDAISTAAAAAQRNSTGNVVYDKSEANTGRMAEIALQNSINIQPTGYALQGQLFNILVARDIDFSDIYSVK